MLLLVHFFALPLPFLWLELELTLLDPETETVAEKLKQEGKAELAQSELTEELEDEEGNVYNRKVGFLGFLLAISLAHVGSRALADPSPFARSVARSLVDVGGPQATGIAVVALSSPARERQSMEVYDKAALQGESASESEREYIQWGQRN
jgi:hypothetical protein